jgi:hypothetical protein
LIASTVQAEEPTMRLFAAAALLVALAAPALAGPCSSPPPAPNTSSVPSPSSPA